MLRIYIAFMLLLLFFGSCKKEQQNQEYLLYGTWVKGSQTGDTLVFMQKDNKNILRYNASFNAVLPALSEKEFTFRGGRLLVKSYLGMSDFFWIDSFTWKRVGHRFALQGSQLFPFMASTAVYFGYDKIN